MQARWERVASGDPSHWVPLTHCVLGVWRSQGVSRAHVVQAYSELCMVTGVPPATRTTLTGCQGQIACSPAAEQLVLALEAVADAPSVDAMIDGLQELAGGVLGEEEAQRILLRAVQPEAALRLRTEWNPCC